MIIRFALPTAVAFCALILASRQDAIAQAGHGHSHGNVDIVVPETAEGVLQDIQKHHAAITAAVSGKNLKAVHDHAEAMTALAKALPGKVAEEKRAVVARTTDNMIKLLDTLHHAADAGNQPRSGIELKKLDGVVAAVEKLLTNSDENS